ncbi:MAG: 2-hydroxychromene-2-carboxylate isomerase [Litorilituus sp.]|jgi:2-hydroxychromene-2-carboxylate isomerase|nr:2-hydroxychromene-2-carboxylate isomerase [Litorilituus sp.]
MIDFYFDFISPYSYIGAMKIEALAAKHGEEVNWRPILLGVSIMKTMGLKPLLDTPLKGEYVRQDLPRLASLYNIPFAFPEHGLPNPIPPARAYCWVKRTAPQKATEFAQAVFSAQWRDERDISNEKVLVKLARDLGLDGEALLIAINSDDNKEYLKKEVADSLAKNIFGGPTFVIDEQVIWGADRLWMLEHWLTQKNWQQTLT